MKLGEAGNHLALMRQNVEATCQGEAQVNSNAKAKIAKLERNHAINNLKTKANSQI